ncbi:phage terminase large subunit [Deinococcus misasensis]|uniref:phage terminase large subunit n=1 Tax=Deinococcus misasensis TaxID=392413 RepID=UPI000557C964|nr:phage terminase large subunit [Deinococcus misasensis]
MELREAAQKPPEDEAPQDLTVEQEKARAVQHLKSNFHAFVRAAWHVMEPMRPMVDNWHIEAICLHLQVMAQSFGQPEGLKDLLINVPPGSSKSLLVNVFFPAWVWTWLPEWRAIFASGDISLSLRDSVKCRDLMKSTWYQENFQPEWKFKGDQDVKGNFANDRGGFRMSTSVGGSGTGHRADSIFVDDPIKAVDRHSEVVRHNVRDWWDTTIFNRLSDMQSGTKVVIMQRLHDEDLSGHILQKYTSFTHLMIPMEYDPDRHCNTPYWSDPRTEFGQLMDPVRFPRSVVDQMKVALGSVDYAGQCQQTPAPTDGAIFKRANWRFWLPIDFAQLATRTDMTSYRSETGEMIQLPIKILPYTLKEICEQSGIFDEMLESWDMTFKDKQTSAFTVGQVWGRIGIDKFLLDEVRGRWNINVVLKQFIELSDKYPHAAAKLVEDKANGPAVMDLLRGTISGLLDVLPYGDKVSRAWAVQPSQEAGEWYLPHPALYHWVQDWINEFTRFPNGFKDRIDTASQAVQQLNLNAQKTGHQKKRTVIHHN